MNKAQSVFTIQHKFITQTASVSLKWRTYITQIDYLAFNSRWKCQSDRFTEYWHEDVFKTKTMNP